MFKVITIAVAIAATAAVAGAQGTSAYKSTAKPTQQASAKRHRKVQKAEESQAALQKEAKITEATARATALKEVPNGTVKAVELEREGGKLIYSYDITVAGKTGIEEVAVNAIDGSVVSRSHETPRMEKKEAAAEAKEKKAKK